MDPSLIPVPISGIKEVKEVLPQTISAIDNALASVVDIAITPVEYVKAYRDYALTKTKASLQEKLKNIPSENIIPPAPYIAVPALQAISYSCDCDELHEMFASLLATSMNKETESLAHPAFVEIIKQLSPKDARILNSQVLKESEVIPKCDVRFQSPSVHILGLPFHHLSKGVAVYTNVVVINGFDPLNDTPLSFGNFLRLGLYEVSGTYLTEVERYEQFKKILSLVRHVKPEPLSKEKSEFAFRLIPGAIVITQLGINFRAACIS